MVDLDVTEWQEPGLYVLTWPRGQWQLEYVNTRTKRGARRKRIHAFGCYDGIGPDGRCLYGCMVRRVEKVDRMAPRV